MAWGGCSGTCDNLRLYLEAYSFISFSHFDWHVAWFVTKPKDLIVARRCVPSVQACAEAWRL